MRIEIARLHRELGNTMIYVTHDQTEAMTLADMIVVLRDGRVEQTGSPREIYENPANTFVAGFIGSPRMNLLNAEWVGDGSVRIGKSRIAAPIDARLMAPGDKLTVGIRPEHMNAVVDDEGTLRARVDFHEYLGGTQFLYCQLEDGQAVTAEYRSSLPVQAGDILHFRWKADDLRLFDAAGLRLRPFDQSSAQKG